MRRRRFLELTGTATAAAACRPSLSDRGGPRGRGAAFTHGVASGDPLTNRVILWTRVDATGELDVRWEIARDPSFATIVSHGVVSTGPAQDHTVKVDAGGLSPGSTYAYRFEARGVQSPLGRTRTLPVGRVERVALAVTSCSNLPWGHFNVYGAIAARDDIDAVVHLGDYIYEYANAQYGDGAALKRLPEPRDRECVTLADYRQRHACYKRDGQLQAVHARHPFIVVWDDHELANDAWIDGAQNHQPEEGSWRSRRDAAVQAWHEWMPVRDGVDPLQIHRSFRFGDLLELAMLDTRLVGREQQQARTALDALANPSRQLLGVAQEQWLRDRLTQSSADGVAWRALGQQIMMAQLRDREGQVYNTDMWDGYPSARTRLYDVLEAASIRDTIVLTGDIHSSWASELRRDPFGPTPSPALAVELTTPAVSSPPPEQPPDLARLLEVHPHVRWVDMQHRGYIAVRFEPQQVRAVWHHTADVTSVHTDVPARKAFVIPRGEAALVDDGSSGD